jgi:hypothetical protein
MFVITHLDTASYKKPSALDKNLTWSVEEHSAIEILKDRYLLISSILLLTCTFLFVIYFA